MQDIRLGDEHRRRGTQGLSTIDHALDVLEALSNAARPLAVGELARDLQMSKSTTHRVLVTLARRRFVRQLNDGGAYTVGIKAFEVGASFLLQTEFRSVSLPEMEHLSEATQETIHLVILEGDEVVYIEKINSPRPYSVSTRVGSRSPAYCTAAGKALLAYLDPGALAQVLRSPRQRLTPRTITDEGILRKELAQIQVEGYAIDREEIEPNLCCIAAPVFNHQHNPVGAIGIAGPSVRILDRVNEHRDHVIAAAARISQALGHT